jgi:hypothetical protein
MDVVCFTTTSTFGKAHAITNPISNGNKQRMPTLFCSYSSDMSIEISSAGAECVRAPTEI